MDILGSFAVDPKICLVTWLYTGQEWGTGRLGLGPGKAGKARGLGLDQSKD